MTCNLITNAFLLHSVRRVRLRWNRSDLEDISEFKQLMDAVDKYEILAHLKLGEDGIEHLAEITPKNGDMGAIKQIPTFEIREIHEENQLKGIAKMIFQREIRYTLKIARIFDLDDVCDLINHFSDDRLVVRMDRFSRQQLLREILLIL